MGKVPKVNHSQHAELLAELRAIRSVLERNERAAESDAAIPAEVVERAATLGPVVDGATGKREAPPSPGAQRKRNERRGK